MNKRTFFAVLLAALVVAIGTVVAVGGSLNRAQSGTVARKFGNEDI